MGWLLDPLAGGLLSRALAEVLLVGAACGPLGVWVLLYRQSYAAESVAHSMLPGLVAAALLGLPLALGGAAGLLVAAGAIALAGDDERLGADVGVAVAVTALFGAGALLALSPDVPPRLAELLFGDPLGASDSDLAVAGGLAAGTVAGLAVAHRTLSLGSFDPVAAGSLGTRPGGARLLLLVLLGACTLAAVQGLGNLLLAALILGPASAALQLTRRLAPALGAAALLAMGAGLAGLLVSYHLDVAAGAAIALCAVAAVPLTAGLSAVTARAPQRT